MAPSLELPNKETETIGACSRHIEFLDGEIAAVERQIASDALDSHEIRRLMTVPGVNVICAATFMAAVGDIGRFRTQRQLVGYLGLDPRVYQSGSAPATGGHISKQGSASTRWALVEAAWSAVRQPGPQHAFYQRVRARRGHGIAIVASARKLACLFWFLLTRGEDYAHQQPSLTAKKLRLLEIRAGAPTLKGTPTGVWATRQAMRAGERRLAEQAEASYKRMVSDWQAATPTKKAGASVTPGRASQKPSKGKVARQTTSPYVCTSTRPLLAPTRSLTPSRLPDNMPAGSGGDPAYPKTAELHALQPAPRRNQPHKRVLRPSRGDPRPIRCPKLVPKLTRKRLTFIGRPEQACQAGPSARSLAWESSSAASCES